MVALLDYSKAAEALSAHAHAACTCDGRSRGQMVGGPTSHVLAALVRAPGVLRALTKAGISRLPALDRVFSVFCAGCSRLPRPGVLGFLCRAFSVSYSCAGCSRLP